MNISAINYRIPFSGRICCEKVNSKVLKEGYVIQETAFFREPETLEFVKEYIKQNFKNGAKIFDGACSYGDETYSLAMLLKDLPNIEITAFDLGENAIREAKEGVAHLTQLPAFQIMNIFHTYCKDSYLGFEATRVLNDKEKEYKSLFGEFFVPVGQQDDYVPALNKMKWKNTTKIFKVRPDKVKNCNFIQANIMETDEFIKDGEANVILFRNALYHLISDYKCRIRRPKPESEVRPILEKLFDDIRRKLSKNGIFVLGGNEKAQTFNNKVVEDVLREKGFVPVLNQKGQTSVWKKA